MIRSYLESSWPDRRAASIGVNRVAVELAALVEPYEKPLGVQTEQRIAFRAGGVNQIPLRAAEVAGIERRPQQLFDVRAASAGQHGLDDVCEHLLSWRDVPLHGL